MMTFANLKGRVVAFAQRLVALYSHLRFSAQAPLRAQIKRHSEHWHLDNAIFISHDLVPRLIEAGLPREARVLVVGCCNMLEIYTFLSYGFRHVEGIDLVSHNPRFIKVMDMHDMRFADGSFDAIYCAGALHCSHAPERLAAEFARVLKPAGLVAISVPVKFPLDEFYIFDAENVEGVHRLFGVHKRDVLWEATIPANGPTNPNSNVTVRTVFRIRGGGNAVSY